MYLNPVSIGQYIQSNRKALSLTQAELGERLGVSSQAVSHWERGDSIPEISLLTDLAELFGCSVDAILHGGEYSGGTARRITAAQMREAVECLHRMYDLLGADHFFCQTMLGALNKRMNSDITQAFSNPVMMDAYVCEALLACVQQGNAWVDLHDVERNIHSERPRRATIQMLRQLGLK